MRAMPGSPLKRAHKQDVRLADGGIMAFPCMPRVAHLPPGWRHFSAAKKIEHLIGLDRCNEILSRPWADVDPRRLTLKIQVIRFIFMIDPKAVIDGNLDAMLPGARE